jgi:hypothetical protein
VTAPPAPVLFSRFKSIIFSRFKSIRFGRFKSILFSRFKSILFGRFKSILFASFPSPGHTHASSQRTCVSVVYGLDLDLTPSLASRSLPVRFVVRSVTPTPTRSAHRICSAPPGVLPGGSSCQSIQTTRITR